VVDELIGFGGGVILTARAMRERSRALRGRRTGGTGARRIESRSWSGQAASFTLPG
jgi:hypothetical protein